MDPSPATDRDLRIGLLVCGHVRPDALDVAGGDYPELFSALFAPFGMEVTSYHVDEGRLPASIDECDGWITSPSRSSVLSDTGWVVELGSFVAELVARERPFAGICFGHQLLAQTLGGTVSRAPGGWGAGVQTYDVVEHRPWMDPPLDHYNLIASHEDQVIELPPGGVVLARADYCPIAAFEVGDRAIGVQAHPEFSPELSRRLTTLRRELLGDEVADQALATLDRPLDRLTLVRWIANFIRSNAT